MEKLQTITLGSDPVLPPDAPLCPVEEPVSQPEPAGVQGLVSRLNGWKEKLHWKPIPWKTLCSPRNALIASCVALIAVAGYLNVRFSTPLQDVPSAPIDGIQPPTQEDSNTSAGSLESFFAQAVISRERVRDEAIDVLRELTENESADEVARQDAYEQMNRLADEISSEVNIENLVRSKGFAQCVAVVSQENVNVIVQSEGLTPGEVAQIKEIVYVQTGILPQNIKIIERSAQS